MIMDISEKSTFEKSTFSGNHLFREINIFGKSTFLGNRLVVKSNFRKRDLSGTPIFSENRLFEKSNFGGIDFPGSRTRKHCFGKLNFRKSQFSDILRLTLYFDWVYDGA